MQNLRKSNDRGQFKNNWLNSYHSFSFGTYFDSRYMGVSNLRVINDDCIQPASGFPNHSHQNMEIISYVTKGQLQHMDSMGNGGIIQPGDIQYMSAGTGVTHSEFNPSEELQTQFFQIWLKPETENTKPSYSQKHFPDAEKKNHLKLIVSNDGRDDSIRINSDAHIYCSLLGHGKTVRHNLNTNRMSYIHIVTGKVNINGLELRVGDGLTIENSKQIIIIGLKKSEILLFDLPNTLV